MGGVGFCFLLSVGSRGFRVVLATAVLLERGGDSCPTEIFAAVKESSTQMLGHKSLTAMVVTTAYTGVTTTCSRHYIHNLNFP